MTATVRFVISAYYTALLAFPMLITAQVTGLPRKIVPCDGARPPSGVAGTECACRHLVELAQNIINTGIVLVVVLSALLFAYAGFLYLTNEAIGAQQQAKSIFKNVAIGLIIMLAAWLVVDTLMNSLLGQGFGSTWNAIGPIEGLCRALGIGGIPAGDTTYTGFGGLNP